MARIEDLGRLLAEEDWSNAERVLRRAAKAGDAPAQVPYNLAMVLQKQGKQRPSGQWLKSALAKDPAYQAAWFELGRWAVAEQDLEQAEKAFARAVDLDQADMDAHRNLGRVALRRGNWDLAAEAFSGVAARRSRGARGSLSQPGRAGYGNAR